MGEILLTDPLVVLCLFYLACLLPALLWPDTPRPQRRQGAGPRLMRPPTRHPNVRKEEKP